MYSILFLKIYFNQKYKLPKTKFTRKSNYLGAWKNIRKKYFIRNQFKRFTQKSKINMTQITIILK